MRSFPVVCSTALCLALAATLPAAKIKAIDLKNGFTEVNRIASPLFAGAPSLTIGTIAAAYDKAGKIVRPTSKNIFKMGPAYELDPAVDMGTLLADALRSEAAAMGFKTGGDWTVSGALKEFYVETKQPTGWAAVQYYGVMTVELEVRRGDGAPTKAEWTLYSFNAAYNAGMGRKDETRDSIARQFIEGAHEILSRLNREFFHAAAPDAAKGLRADEAGLYRLSLSGAASTVPALLEMLPTQKDEHVREWIILALARLASAEAVPVLAARYAGEDSVCRWFTLKAMHDIGTPEALALVREKGLKDKDEDVARLAGKILGP
jgi:hypothetical protein